MRCRILLVLAALLAVTQLPADEPTDRPVRIGFVGRGSASSAPRGVSHFWERLRELGYVEGKNLYAERRWAGDRTDDLPRLIVEVLQHHVDLIVTYGTPTAIAAKNATSSIPIVAAVMADPIRYGLVQSLPRPGGNLTGFSMGYGEGLTGKWLELLQETVPRISSIGIITNYDNVVLRDVAKEVQLVAFKRGLKVQIINMRDAGMLEEAELLRSAQAVLVFGDAAVLAYRRSITALAAKHRLPAIYNVRDFVDAGGLMSYGPDTAVQFRRAAEYVDKILRGAKPGDLPVEQPTKFELVVNMKTAKALGITIPESILLRADEVIR
jgi:putative ABC transport system substrate-binding protein